MYDIFNNSQKHPLKCVDFFADCIPNYWFGLVGGLVPFLSELIFILLYSIYVYDKIYHVIVLLFIGKFEL